jgi:thiamine biosynthesis lipoprotein
MAGTLTRRNFLSLDFGDRRAAGDHWVRVHRVAMACRFEVMLSSDDAIDVEAARAALDEADEIESMLTVFRDASEVVEMNRRAADAPVATSPGLFALLQRSAELYERTAGAFDVTATPLSRCWGFLKREGRVPEDADIEQALAHVGMRHVALDAERREVSFARQGVELSFGAIGKGYALDRMADVLRRHGARRALLSAGRNSVLAIGGRGRGWPIDVRSRLAREAAGRLWIRDGAVGTSGAGEQFVVVDGRRYGHVLDPRTGRPAGGVLAASVVTRDAASADALSTAFLIGGTELARAYCAAHADTMALLVLDGTDDPPVVIGRYDGATLEKAG